MSHDEIDDLHALVLGVQDNLDSMRYAAPEMISVFVDRAAWSIAEAVHLCEKVLHEMEPTGNDVDPFILSHLPSYAPDFGAVDADAHTTFGR